jgi:hypothetical protein
MDVETITWGWSEPGRPLSLPISLLPGRCYLIAAVPAPETVGADLDVTLTFQSGRLLASDTGQAETALVYHCPQRSGPYRVSTELYGRRGRFLLVLGASAATQSKGR